MTPASTSTRGVATLLVTALALLAGLAGCALPERPALTLAYTTTINEPAPSLDSVLPVVTDHADAARYPRDGLVTIVGPDTLDKVDLTPLRGDEVETNTDNRRALVARAVTALGEKLAQSSSAVSGLDVVGVLDRALEATPAGGTVALVTSGFSTVAPLDLNAAGAWMSAPTELVDSIDPADIPQATGKRIIIGGLGYPAATSPQQPAGPAARKALTAMYDRLCARADALSCDVLPGPAGRGEPTTRTASPIVPLDMISTHCVGQIDIDTRIAFLPDDDVLQADAEPLLRQIADDLRRCATGTTVSAVGHSATVPDQVTPATALEANRARAVLDRLRALGTSTIGEATAGGQIVDNMPQGIYREDLAVKNRVVTVSVTPGP